MGQTLSEPVTEKKTEIGQDERLAWASSGMQGWRLTMEDAHTSMLNILDQEASPKNQRISFFAVFDGHGGHTVAQYAGEHLRNRLVGVEEFKRGDFTVAMKNAFLGLDDDIRNDPKFSNDSAGCTAVAAIITDDWQVYVANAGDSRAVLGSMSGEAIPLSFDHKPVNPGEMERITAAGGFVEFGRVNGNLALSRAFGDFDFKKNQTLPPELQVVTANPDIIQRQLHEQDEFIVIACDGIWDCMTNQDVVNFIRENVIALDGDLGKVAESLMDKCLSPHSQLGSYGCDNMTVTIVALLRGKTLQEWVEAIKVSVKDIGLVQNFTTKTGVEAESQVILLQNGDESESPAE